MNKIKDEYVSRSVLQPYEKCARFGTESLSDDELLAIIIRKGTKDRDALSIASELLHLYDSKNGILNLMRFSEADFRSIKGIGPVKATQLSAISELSKRIWKERSSRDTRKLDSAADIAALYKEELRHCYQEKVILLLLDSRRRLLRSVAISKGTVNASVISPREIFYEAIQHRAAAFAVVHNHPSGSISPSEADINFATILRFTGNMMNIPLLDCLIIGDNEYLSFSEKGLFREGFGSDQ